MQMIDATHVKAHRSAAGGKGGRKRRLWAARAEGEIRRSAHSQMLKGAALAYLLISDIGRRSADATHAGIWDEGQQLELFADQVESASAATRFGIIAKPTAPKPAARKDLRAQRWQLGAEGFRCHITHFHLC
jgi:hypothetical protein